MDAYARTLGELYARANHGIKLGLDTMRALLDALERPERAMRHVIVAGTNGKGSTSTLIADALAAAGHRVGHFTSPHLLRFGERIKVAGRELGRDEVVRLYARIAAVEGACDRPPTFFEVVTAMGLLAFAEAGVAWSVLEVGMGGRLDATNVVDKRLAVITPVALDHQRYLGDSVAAIAGEKAGVIPPRGSVVMARQHPDAEAVIARVAAERGARLVSAPAAIVARDADGSERLHVATTPRPLVLERWPAGVYQRDNVATAAAALRELAAMGVRCPDEAIAAAAASFVWPGRYQWHEGTPPVLVDGAHNPHGVEALLASLAVDPRAAGKPLHLVSTVLADRPPELMLPPLAAVAASLHLACVRSPRSRSAEELARLAPGARGHRGAAEALAAAAESAREDGGVVIACGSLLLAADVLAVLTGEDRDPPVEG